MHLDPRLAPTLADARLQVHHAAQLATAAGISYLPPRADDSHTNLEWVRDGGMLASNPILGRAPFRLAVGVADLSLSVLDSAGRMVASLSLDGHTVADAVAWLRPRLGERGVDPSRYTLDRHYAIPPHAVDAGTPFRADDSDAFGQLALWFEAGSDALERLRNDDARASNVRCWPHHFDIALLLDEGRGTTIGVGLEPGDAYYDEPYFYVNRHPPPGSAPRATLAGRGTWHEHEWIGAVHLGSDFTDWNPGEQIDAFLRSAIRSFRTA